MVIEQRRYPLLEKNNEEWKNCSSIRKNLFKDIIYLYPELDNNEYLNALIADKINTYNISDYFSELQELISSLKNKSKKKRFSEISKSSIQELYEELVNEFNF